MLILDIAFNLAHFILTGKNMMEQSLPKLLLSLVLVLITSFTSNAQLWSTDFESTNSTVTLNTTDLSGTASGQNVWIINSSYTGGVVGSITVPNTPAQPAGITPNTQNYLHITSVAGQFVSIQNAHIDTTAPNNETYFTEIGTGLSTAGQTGITMNFWFLTNSVAGQAEVYVKDGAAGTWTLLNSADFSTALNSTSNWTQTVYTGSLLDNLSDIYIGFRFVHTAPGSGQPSMSIDNIAINAATTITATIDYPNPLPTVLCVGDTIHFSALTDPSIITYQWNFNGANNGTQALLGSSVVFEAASVVNPTTYTIELIVSDGVTQDAQTFNLTIIPCNAPDIDVSGTPTIICENTSTTFTNNTTPGSAPIDSIRWTFPGGTPATSNQNNPTITYSTPGLYDVQFAVYDSNGTYDTLLTDYIQVLSCPPPVADFEATETELCPGDCIGFIDQSTNMSGAGSTWLWEFAGSDSAISTVQHPQNICYSTPGLYEVTLTVTNVNGTDSKVRTGYIQVDSCLAPEANFNVEKDSICQNTCIQFYNTGIRDDSLHWTFYGADDVYLYSNDKNPVVCYSDTGLFDVELFSSNQYGVDIKLMVDYVSVKAFPEVQAGEDKTILIDKSVRLEAYGSSNKYQWTPEYEIEGSDTRTPTVSPKENTVYYVTNINSHGCKSTDSLRVLVQHDYYSGVPDIFSPNADGVNDILYVRGNGITELEFMIYNRMGQQIFQSYSQDIGWDGTYKGQEENPGVYVYFAKITYLNGYQEIIKGDVTLIR